MTRLRGVGLLMSFGSILVACNAKQSKSSGLASSTAGAFDSPAAPSPSAPVVSSDATKASGQEQAAATSLSLAKANIVTFPIPPGDPACALGGELVVAFSDLDNSGTYSPDELISSRAVCNGVAASDPGYKMVVVQAKIPVGAKLCAAGGVSISSFLDVAKTGIYDASVDTGFQQTSICNSYAQLEQADQDAIDLTTRIASIAGTKATVASDAASAADKALEAAKLAYDQAAAQLTTNLDTNARTAAALKTAQAKFDLVNAQATKNAMDLKNDSEQLSMLLANIDTSKVDPSHTYAYTDPAGWQALLDLSRSFQPDADSYFAADLGAASLDKQVSAAIDAATKLILDLSSDAKLAAALNAEGLKAYQLQLKARAGSQPHAYNEITDALQKGIDSLGSSPFASGDDLAVFLRADSIVNATLKDFEAAARLHALTDELIAYKDLTARIPDEALAVQADATFVTAATSDVKAAQDASDAALTASKGDAAAAEQTKANLEANLATAAAAAKEQAAAQAAFTQATADAAAQQAQFAADKATYQAAQDAAANAALLQSNAGGTTAP